VSLLVFFSCLSPLVFTLAIIRRTNLWVVGGTLLPNRGLSPSRERGEDCRPHPLSPPPRLLTFYFFLTCLQGRSPDRPPRIALFSIYTPFQHRDASCVLLQRVFSSWMKKPIPVRHRSAERLRLSGFYCLPSSKRVAKN